MSDAITCNALISACETSAKPEQALDVFQSMPHQGLRANEITYGTLISTCEKGRRFEWAMEVFEAMQRQVKVPNTIT